MIRIGLALIVLLAGTVPPCAAGTRTQKQGAATLEVRFDAPEPTLELADVITVTLTIEGSAALETPAAPPELAAAAPWMLLERTRPVRKTIGRDRRHWQITYRFAPRQPGKAVPFAFPNVKYQDGEEYTASWRPLAFVVTTRIAAPDLTDLRDVTAIEDLPPVGAKNDWWLIGTLIGGACVLLFAAVVGLHAWLRRTAARSAARLALYELQRLIALKLPEQGRSERFITLLTTLVRRYLERQFTIPARRQTTPEFLRDLAQHAMLTAEEKQFLGNFLECCEAVKFADLEMPAEECAQWAAATRDFLQRRCD